MSTMANIEIPWIKVILETDLLKQNAFAVGWRSVSLHERNLYAFIQFVQLSGVMPFSCVCIFWTNVWTKNVGTVSLCLFKLGWYVRYTPAMCGCRLTRKLERRSRTILHINGLGNFTCARFFRSRRNFLITDDKWAGLRASITLSMSARAVACWFCCPKWSPVNIFGYFSPSFCLLWSDMGPRWHCTVARITDGGMLSLLASTSLGTRPSTLVRSWR